MKYGRSGSPHVRLVYLSDDLQRVCWCVPKDGKRPSRDAHIRVIDITDLTIVTPLKYYIWFIICR